MDGSISEESETDSEEDVTDGELEWLERDLENVIMKEDPKTKTSKLLKETQSQLRTTRGSKAKTLKKHGIKNMRSGYTPIKASTDDFWRMRRLMAKLDLAYDSDSDPDYSPGDEVELVSRLRAEMESDTQGDTSFTGSTAASSVHNRSVRSRKASVSGNPVPKRPLPYWVAAVSKAEKFDPELEKFVAEDKYYKEEEDPDYVLPATDDDTGTEEDEEPAEQILTLESDGDQAGEKERKPLLWE